ncbi:unnamed protein product [Microthlaspi erraticum]|uniref:Uncharacterized protein n=1 Tax=Microthlaspi erraticum TaxID=1685480 RepID=A0A6D2K3N5_9BRAS|nr:unnamed protein product [Microthlaspi erraticum]
MDFIKTSSLRALIELTFQRNWNGLIWMSRKGVTTKRVKTVQTALSRTAPNRAVRLAENECSALGQITSVRLKSRPKFQTDSADHASRPGKHCPAVGQASSVTPAAHDQSARAGNKPRGRATRSRTTADASVRAGKERPTSGREFIGQIYPLDHAGRP